MMLMMMMIKKVTRPAARPWRKFGLDVSASISGRSTTVKSEDTFLWSVWFVFTTIHLYLLATVSITCLSKNTSVHGNRHIGQVKGSTFVGHMLNEKSNVLSGCICVHSTKVHEYALIVSNARDFKPQERHGLDRIITQLSRVPVKYAAASRSMSPLDHGTLFIKFKLWGNTMSYPSVNRNLQNPFFCQKKKLSWDLKHDSHHLPNHYCWSTRHKQEWITRPFYIILSEGIQALKCWDFPTMKCIG